MSRLCAIISRNPLFEFLMDVAVKIAILRDMGLVVYWEFTDVSGKLTTFIFRMGEFPKDGGRSFCRKSCKFVTNYTASPAVTALSICRNVYSLS
jgi:hypothetical protein